MKLSYVCNKNPSNKKDIFNLLIKTKFNLNYIQLIMGIRMPYRYNEKVVKIANLAIGKIWRNLKICIGFNIISSTKLKNISK